MLINICNGSYNFLISRIIKDVLKFNISESPALLIISLDELCSVLVTETNICVRDTNDLQHPVASNSECLLLHLCDFVVLHTKLIKDPSENTAY